MEDHISSRIEQIARELSNQPNTDSTQFTTLTTNFMKDLMEHNINTFKDISYLLLESIEPQLRAAIDQASTVYKQYHEVLIDMKYVVSVSEIEEVNAFLEEHEKIQRLFMECKNSRNPEDILSVKWYKLSKFIMDNLDNTTALRQSNWIPFITLRVHQHLNLKTSLMSQQIESPSLARLEPLNNQLFQILDVMKDTGKLHLQNMKHHIKDVAGRINFKTVAPNQLSRSGALHHLINSILALYQDFQNALVNCTPKPTFSSMLKQTSPEKALFTNPEEILLDPESSLNVLNHTRIKQLIVKNFGRVRLMVDTLFPSVPRFLEFREIPNISNLTYDDRWLSSKQDLKITWVYHEPLGDFTNFRDYFIMLFKFHGQPYMVANIDEGTSLRIENWKRKVVYIEIKTSPASRAILHTLNSIKMLHYFYWGLKEYIQLNPHLKEIVLSLRQIVEVFNLLTTSRDAAHNYFDQDVVPQIVSPINSLYNPMASSWPVYNSIYELFNLAQRPLNDYRLFKQATKTLYSSDGRPVIIFNKNVGRQVLDSILSTLTIASQARAFPTGQLNFTQFLSRSGTSAPTKASATPQRNSASTSMLRSFAGTLKKSVMTYEGTPVKSINLSTVSTLKRIDNPSAQRTPPSQNLKSSQMQLSRNSAPRQSNGVFTRGRAEPLPYKVQRSLFPDQFSTPIKKSTLDPSTVRQSLGSPTFSQYGQGSNIQQVYRLEQVPMVASTMNTTQYKTLPTIPGGDAGADMTLAHATSLNQTTPKSSRTFLFQKKGMNTLPEYDMLIVHPSNQFNILLSIMHVQQNILKSLDVYQCNSKDDSLLLMSHVLPFIYTKFFPLSTDPALLAIPCNVHNVTVEIPPMSLTFSQSSNHILQTLAISKIVSNQALVITQDDLENHIFSNLPGYYDLVFHKLSDGYLDLTDSYFTQGTIQSFPFISVSNLQYNLEESLVHFDDILAHSSQKFVLLEFFEKDHVKITAFLTKDRVLNRTIVELNVSRLKRVRNLDLDKIQLKKVVFDISEFIVSDKVSRQVWNQPSLTTFMMAQRLGNLPTVTDFHDLCEELRDNPVFLINRMSELIEITYSHNLLKTYALQRDLELVIERPHDFQGFTSLLQSKLKYFCPGLLQTWNVMIVQGSVRKYQPIDTDFFRFGPETMNTPTVMLILPTDGEYIGMPFVVMTKMHILVGIYPGFDISKEELLNSTDLLLIYKQRFNEVVSYEQLQLLKIRMDRDLVNLGYHATIYFFLNLISHPLTEQQMKFHTEDLFALWNRANQDKFDKFINDILADPLFGKFGVFIALNNIHDYFDPETYDYFTANLQEKAMRLSENRMKQLKPMTQVIKVKESKSTGDIVSLLIILAWFNSDLTSGLMIYPVNVEEKVEPQELGISVKTLTSLAQQVLPEVSVASVNTIRTPHRFNQKQVLSILFLLTLFLERNLGNALELKEVTKYLMGLLENRAFYFLELLRVLSLEREISEGMYALP